MEDFSDLEQNIKSALVSTIRSANAAGNEDIAFHRSLDASVASSIDSQNARLMGLAERLLGSATANTEIVRPPRLKDLDSIEGNWKAVVDVVDSLLERADTALDEFTGAVKRMSPGVEQSAAPRPPKIAKLANGFKNQDMDKPQLLFDHIPKNDERTPFKPLLQSKPHASAPLEEKPVASDSNSQKAFPHPYQLEIEQYRYPSSVYTESEPIMYHPFESTTATLVDSEEALSEMLEELKQAKEIAIDLEHHDSRSYIGIVSLMQISTRDKDWIVDTLKPWRRKLQCLNEVFANPNIVKVLHGAYMDVMWLQRDLGLYLVGLFDTHYAARALGYSGGSLAFLLKKFVNFDAQKQYQMADWRIRPLPQELFDYARSDTHFLLYIYDCMRNELIQKSDFTIPNHEGDKIWDVLQKSSETALQRYEHPIYDTEFGQGPGGWFGLLRRTPAPYTKEQFSVFRAVHKWRDDVAREQDDSVHFVMPNHNIFTLAKSMPTTRQEFAAQIPSPTQTIRQRTDELLGVIINAKASGDTGPELNDILQKFDPMSAAKLKAAQRSAQQAAVPAPRAKSPPLPMNITSNVPIRSSTSSFWGKAFASSAWQPKRELSSLQNVPLSVPLPPLTAEVFAEPAEEKADLAHLPASEAMQPPAKAEEEEEDVDDTFVLKDMGKKRKRAHPMDAMDDGMAANTDVVTLPDTQSEAAQQKRERKAAKRAAKKEAKAAATNGGSGDGEEDVPFDYASAPSILNPSREGGKETAKERKKKERQMNPYAKAMDAPKGLPRKQKEKAGKSMTYKY